MTLRTIRHAIGLSLLVICLLVICLKSGLLQAAPPTTNFVPQALSDAVEEGNAAYEKKDYAVARKAYERVLKLDGSNLMGLVNLGLVESALGNKAKAEETLKKAISIRLETAPAWLALGMMYMDEDRSDAALAALSQAALYDPQNARTRNFLGVVIGRRGWIDGAQTELRRAVELDPSYTDAHYNLAVFYLQEKAPAIELARRHYFKARELGLEKDNEMEKVFITTSPKP